MHPRDFILAIRVRVSGQRQQFSIRQEIDRIQKVGRHRTLSLAPLPALHRRNRSVRHSPYLPPESSSRMNVFASLYSSGFRRQPEMNM
jgi:hypothetical protein